MSRPSPADLSVVVPTHQRRDLVLRAVRSVLSGRVQPAEILVVDDGSTDGTVDAVASLDDRVRVARHPARRGVAAARNTGIRAARGRWIALLDSDDQWLPDHLERLIGYLAAEPRWRIAQGLERWYRGGVRVNPRPVHRPRVGDIFLPSLQRCLVSSSAVVFERELVVAEGGYDERLVACEDYDLWLRLARHTPFGLVEEETVVKDGGRADQLSRRIWGLDRFRVFVLAKLLVTPLAPPRFEATRTVCLKKLGVLESGARRRGLAGAERAYGRWRRAVRRAGSGALGQVDCGDLGLEALLSAANVGANERSEDPILDGLLPGPPAASARSLEGGGSM